MKQNKKIIILLLVLIIVVSTVGTIIAKYKSEATAKKELEVAYYVLGTQLQNQTLKLDAMVPRDEPYKYGIVITNSENERISETAIQYTLQVKTTTNLPLNFALYIEGKDDNQIIDTQTIQDDDGMYYLNMTSGVKEMGLEKEEHKYVLTINFPKEYKINSEYSDVIELVEITVDSKQKI